MKIADFGGVAEAARAAAEAARKAAEEAARRAAQEAARRAAETSAKEAARNAAHLAAQAEGTFLPSSATSVFAAPSATAVGRGPSWPVSGALCLAAGGAGGGTLPPGETGVVVDPGKGASAMADDWLRAMKASVGVGDPRVFDDYMRVQGRGLLQLGQALDPRLPASPDTLLRADLSQQTGAFAVPALRSLQADHPDATFRLLAVESPDPSALPGQLVVEMQQGGGTQQWAIDVPRDPVIVQELAARAAAADPAWLERWRASFQGTPEAGLVPDGDAGFKARYLVGTNYAGFVQSLKGLGPADQQAFLGQLAETFLVPTQVDREEVMVSVDVTALARGEAPGPLASVVDTAAVDGLATSTVVPPVGTSAEDWRKTLEALAANPPAGVEQLKSEIVRLSDGVTMDELNAVAARDANALPAILNAVRAYPAIDFNRDLAIRFAGSGSGATAFTSMSYDKANGVVVVDTSLDKLLGAAATADLDTNYAIADIPMTLRIPVPESAAGLDWANPSPEALEVLDQQMASIGEVSLFLHGYQSDRRVWTSGMQKWMDQAARPVVGIAMAGMGSEGDFLGSGDSMLTPRQYAFHTMEALDRLGLYGKDLDVIGHSMGGAAALQMGLATERLVAAGADKPDVRYVLLEPAPAGDSVPFLTSTPGISAAIGLQNWAGTTDVLGISLEGLAYGGNSLLGGPIIDTLLPTAPAYIKDVHKHFAEGAGFAQLKATASGLTGQPEPDPAEVAAFLAANPVLVVAGSGDKIVATPVVQGIFGAGNVVVVQGDHYAHVEDPKVLEELRALFARPFDVPGTRAGAVPIR